MTRAIESISAIIKNFIDKDPKPPLHVGEVMDLWTIFTAFHEAHSLYQVALNSTIDPDLQHVVQNALEGSKKDTQDIEDFLLKEGVPLPLVNPKKPLSNAAAVPEGVKLSDDEIANLIAVKIASSITFCAQAMSKTVRTDVGILFFEIQVELMKFAAPLKNLMKERGWLRVPPKYSPPGRPE
ncbi:DUF3231 family protein [Metabacillus idriensis]|uniref:DUF3231 family protein n=1 Tax=Metabacillus idriensis TaxID=324768 RepID=A0A6I2M487_9BACI|nr:DUF3231 family protein [Metabacillus idriensis]MCM3595065.1 DUF3231 family protein [Metabacillus idriensis]MRX52908.1 DUF3231 family protein [Metabacillus idriensis]OHR65534.1 hypothetical protein HMPREF3291_02860 [Bacillus sp. HMSC76G11]